MYKFKIGTDPEFGIVDKNGYIFPPNGLFEIYDHKVKPNKNHPEHWIFSRLNNPPTVLHMDGAALELEIQPEETPEKLWINLQKGIALAESVIEPYNNLELSLLPTLPWNIEEYTENRYGKEFIHANRFGCDEDFDAFNMEEEQLEEDASKHPYRYFGGHIHLGMPEHLMENTRMYPDILAKICAVYWGNLCTFKSKYYGMEKLRMYRYGKPGRYRPQPHGIEYRSPSNSWTSNFDTVKEIFNSANSIITAFDNMNLATKVLELAEPTKEAIESFDIESCKDIYKDAKRLYESI
jgi:hypothetical protein